MTNNLFKNMDYKTYKIFQNISVASFPLGIINLAFSDVIDIPTLELFFRSYIYLSQTYYVYTILEDCEKYTKDITYITSLYDEVLDKYTKLINTLELIHPIEIYSIYNYMLYKGHLSNNGNFKFGKSGIEDIRSLLGVNVITGKSVCRHIASMLDDIYNKLNINSSTYTVYLGDEAKNILRLELLIKEFELQLLKSTDDKEKTELLGLISKNNELINKYQKQIDKKKRANHMITIASKDNIGYIMDPTNRFIYKKIDDKEKDISKIKVFNEKSGFVKLTKENGNYKQKKEILSLPNTTLEEDKLIIDKTNILCNNNLDLLDNFKNNNKDLYSEINDKLIKIKKKK